MMPSRVQVTKKHLPAYRVRACAVMLNPGLHRAHAFTEPYEPRLAPEFDPPGQEKGDGVERDWIVV